MTTRRFRYALEPILLMRRWALDALLQNLAEQNSLISALAAEGAILQTNYAAATTDWRTITADREAQPAQRFSVHYHYLNYLAAQLRSCAARMVLLDAAREDIAAQVANAQRLVEAAEQHRDAMEKQFLQKRASADFKFADEQWNTRQLGTPIYGN